MTDREAEPGLELVLDNRKLILVFAVLIVICGCFFVVGFIEGKRQGIQEGQQMASEFMPKAAAGELQAQASASPGADSDANLVKEESQEQQLNWYKNVNRRDGEPEVVSQKMKPSSPAKAPEPVAKAETTPMAQPVAKSGTTPASESAVKPKPQTSVASSGPVTYSVQVGAFRVRREAEIRAKALQSKGYDCRMEPPDSPDRFYLIKVGEFKTRAEAVAMQLRLKKSGFNCFVKTN